ncbi:MAG: Twitching motility protein PilT [Deltaproteobacteria bacterium]|nr:Twitching motility protein PilT [Deltaproteobacteria bacterium]
MAAIDTYIGYLSKFGASAIILESGKQILVRLPTGDRSATQTLSFEALQAVIEECAPSGALAELLVQHTTAFDYAGGPQPVRCTVTQGPSVMRIVIAVPDASDRAPLQAAPPTRAPEPRAAGKPVAIVAPSPPTPSPAAVAVPVAVPVAAPIEPPISRVTSGTRPLKLDEMLRAMKEMGASDLHMSCTMPPLVRKDGEMKPVPGFPVLTPELMLQLLYEVCPEKNRKEFEERSDTDFAYAIEGLSRFRANMFRDRHGPGGVFRAIPFNILSPEQLGIPPKVLELCYLTKGLVVVTGPTGSGKSTTLATLVDHINSNRSDHIITIEDPIEFVHNNKKCLVNQREVHVHTRSFKDALRAALREDPDIVLVGEMRDLETIAIAVETAETGHLVFGTLHTTTAPSTVDRIIDQFPSDRQSQVRQMLAESLRGVIAQTLCKKIGGGRVAAYEVLIGTSAVRNLIRTSKTFQLFSVMQTGKDVGMITLNDSLLELVKAKKVEPLEAYMKAVQKPELKAAMQKLGFTVNVADEKE